jgi:hypothetical protein
VFSNNLIKDDPLRAMQQEEKREHPVALLPEEPTRRLAAKIKDNLMNSKATSKTIPIPFTRNNRTLGSTVKGPRTTINEDSSAMMSLTTKRLTRALETTRSLDSVEEVPMLTLRDTINVIERSPLKADFSSKAEL